MLLKRRDCRSFHGPCRPTTLAEAIWCCLHHSAIPARDIATRMNLRLGYLLDAANPDRDEHHFQTRWLVPLMTLTSNYAPIRFLAGQLGGVFVELPAVAAGHEDIRAAFVHAVTEIGEDARTIEAALADTRVVDDEAMRIEEEIDQTIAALLRVKAVVRQKAEAP